jgi:hypothetical protein
LTAQTALFRRRRAPELQPERRAAAHRPAHAAPPDPPLERDLKAPLFVRGQAGVRLSPAGHTFFDDARALLSAADAARRCVAGTATCAHTFIAGFMPA